MASKKRLPKIQPVVLKSDLDPVKVRKAVRAVLAARNVREVVTYTSHESCRTG